MLTHIHNRYKLIFNVFFSNLFKINKKSLFICQYILYFLRFSIIPDIIVFYHKMVKYSPHQKKTAASTALVGTMNTSHPLYTYPAICLK